MASTGMEEVKVDVQKPDLLSTKTAQLELRKISKRTTRDETKSFKYKTEGKLTFMSLLVWENTMLPAVLTKFDVWAGTGFHTILFIIERINDDATPKSAENNYFKNWQVQFGAIGMATWLMVFTLTFFVGQCYNRYLSHYNSCMGMGGKLLEIAQKLAVDFETLPEERWHVVRYLTASIELVFGDTQRGKGPAGIHKELFWKRLSEPESSFLGHEVKSGDGFVIECPPLLTDAEIEVLKAYNGNRGELLRTWALKAAVTGYEQMGVTRAYCPIRADITKIRQAGAGILNTLNLPVPFPYYHILLLITVFNYFLFGFAFLTMNSYLSPLVIFMVCLLLSGVRELGCELADPFGDDAQDFPVMKFMTNMRAGASPLARSIPWYPGALKSQTMDIKKTVMSTFALPPPS